MTSHDLQRGDGPRGPAPPNKPTDAEREELITALNSAQFVDKAPRQVWAALLDQATYLASVSTMYRLLRESGELAAEFMENAIRANGGIAPATIHSDNGTSMTSKPVTGLPAPSTSSSPTPGRR